MLVKYMTSNEICSSLYTFSFSKKQPSSTPEHYFVLVF